MQLPTPKFICRRTFYQKRKTPQQVSIALCVLKTKNVHLSVHLCGGGVHSLPLNSLWATLAMPSLSLLVEYLLYSVPTLTSVPCAPII